MKYFFLKAFFIAVVAGVVFATPVFALTVSPVRIEFSGNPGDTIIGELNLFNEQPATKTFYSSFQNFEAGGETGAPHFIGAQGGLATWMTAPKSIVLNQNQQKVVNFSIHIPENAEPGGHFAAIFWGDQPPALDGSSQVAIGGKLGVLILLTVRGDVKQEGGIIEFFAEGNKKFFDSLSVNFVYRVRNNGGDRIVPNGDMVIKNLFIIPSAKVLANENRGSVLPNSSRKFEVSWGPKSSQTPRSGESGFFKKALFQIQNFHFGYYSAALDLELGLPERARSGSYYFFIIPWQLLTIIVIILFLVFPFLWFCVRGYNRWLINRVMSQESPKLPNESSKLIAAENAASEQPVAENIKALSQKEKNVKRKKK